MPSDGILLASLAGNQVSLIRVNARYCQIRAEVGLGSSISDTHLCNRAQLPDSHRSRKHLHAAGNREQIYDWRPEKTRAGTPANPCGDSHESSPAGVNEVSEWRIRNQMCVKACAWMRWRHAISRSANVLLDDGHLTRVSSERSNSLSNNNIAPFPPGNDISLQIRRLKKKQLNLVSLRQTKWQKLGNFKAVVRLQV